MNPLRKSITTVIAALGLCAVVDSATAQTTVTTDPVGFVQLSLPGQSDTRVSVPFTQAPAFVGTVQSTSSNTITFSGTPGWTANQFVYASGVQPNTYYALIGTAGTSDTTGTMPKEGSIYTITANTANTLTLNVNGDNVSIVSEGTQISIIPYWTLATVFPASNANVSFTPSTSPLLLQTQLMFLNYAAVGINASSANIYYFYNGAWRLMGDSSSTDHSNDVILPNVYFTVRNPTTTTNLVALGTVPMGTIGVNLVTQSSGQQDNYLSLLRPIGVSLENSGLISSGAFSASASPLMLSDCLFVFDNTQVGFNKSASEIYYYYNNGWRQMGQSSSTDFGSTLLPVGSGFVIRKAAVANGPTQVWQHTPPYPTE